MPLPQASLLTWTCYGTWLHGDALGSIDDQHNQFGLPLVVPDPEYLRMSVSALKHAPVTLDKPRRDLVYATIEAHAAYRRWGLLALNVRTNHVHAVVGGIDIEPGLAAGQFKAWTTRRLREAGLIQPKQEVWTKRSSTRYLWEKDHVLRACKYFLDGQGVDL
jgi:REP element-mobilizing transposase RayT